MQVTDGSSISAKKSELLLDSVYTVEPLNEVYAWNNGHWNYQWDGRQSIFNTTELQKSRIEPDGSIIVKTKDGHIVRFFD
jgi:hypothetical protein